MQVIFNKTDNFHNARFPAFGDMLLHRPLLRETDLTVECVAAEVGYENVEHFNRLFKKNYGLTPVQ